MTEDSIFDVRSITKPVTALAALVLVDRKRLHLDAPITDSLPEARSSKWAHQVTLRHLLTHTSGLDHARPAEFKALTESRDVPLARVASAVVNMPLEGTVGGSWRYSSPGYCLIGRLIEAAAQTSFGEFVTNAVLRPLGMRDSSFLPPIESRNRLASLYEWKKNKLVPWPRRLPDERWTYEGPDFGLYSTAKDLAKLIESMWSEDFRLFNPALRRMMLTAASPTDVRGLGQGLGWMVAQTNEPPGLKARCFGHNGAGGSMAWGDPESATVAVFLTQCFSTTSTAGSEVVRLAFSK
jgi:CubicO group peptidase (beta-lactamase class C family)